MGPALYLCLHLRDFAAEAAMRAHPELRRRPLAILSGTPPLEFVFELNRLARELGLEPGMTRVQAESFAGTEVLRPDRAQEERAFDDLMRHADRLSPRVQAIASPEEFSSGATLILDIANSGRLLGTPQQIAEALQRDIHAAGYEASIAVSTNAYAAALAARGLTQGLDGIQPQQAQLGRSLGPPAILAPGREAQTLSPLPLRVMELDPELAQTFAAWGVHTLGQLAAIPLKSLVARLGQQGHRLHLLARGEYDHLLVPEEAPPDAALIERVELDHPVELLEPLLFLISSALEKLTRRAAERALAIASIETCFVFACGGGNASGVLPKKDAEAFEYRRAVRPALPERDHRTLLKLIQLDLEMHPPRAGVTAFTIRAQPARPQKVQQGLFALQTPESGRLEVLLARLRKLVGDERVGSPELLDTHAPDAFRVGEFSKSEEAERVANSHPRPASTGQIWDTAHRVPPAALRMVRPPVLVRVATNGSSPATLLLEGRQLSVEISSGPWRTSGAWWTNNNWCREEWDITLKGSPHCLRLAFDPGAGSWHLIGIYD